MRVKAGVEKCHRDTTPGNPFVRAETNWRRQDVARLFEDGAVSVNLFAGTFEDLNTRSANAVALAREGIRGDECAKLLFKRGKRNETVAGDATANRASFDQ